MISVGLVQLTSTDDRDENLRQVERFVRAAADRGAQLVALPENFSYLGSETGKLSIAEPLEGPLTERLGRLARDTGIWLLAGGLPEQSGDPGRVYNTAVLFDAAGAISAVYRKIHLFDVDIAGGVTYQESRTVQPGSTPVVADTPWGRIGLSICYDLRFPELYRRLTALGADLVFVPSAFTLYTGKDHWRVLLQARAIENTIYVAAPAQFGVHGPKRQSYGRSLVADPWGQVIAEAPDRPGVVLADIDFEYLRTVRQQLPSLQHRRLE
jgi:predicted amidohydrolase